MGKNSFDKYIEERIKKDSSLGEELDKASSAIEVGFQIYILRKKMGLTQTQLAKKIGVSQSNIARIENADYNHYAMKTLYKVAKGLGADLNIFINLPEQTINLISAVDNFPAFQNFIYAGATGRYFVSGSGTVNRQETSTLGPIIESENVRVSAESRNSEAEVNRLYYSTLWI